MRLLKSPGNGGRSAVRSRCRRSILHMLASLLPLALLAASLRAQLTPADYERALSLQQKYRGLVLHLPDAPEWANAADRFVYRRTVHGGHEFVLVDAEKQTAGPAFDHARLAASLAKSLGEPVRPETLPFETAHLDGNTLEFERGPEHWRCDLATYECAKLPAPPDHPADPEDEGYDSTPPAINGPAAGRLSPDGKWLALVENYNVAVRPADLRGEDAVRRTVALSQDGSEGNYYAVGTFAWSPDSKHLAAYRIRPGYRRLVHYVESSPADQLQPKSSAIVYPKPGDLLPLFQPALFQIEDKRQFAIENTLFPNPYQLTPFAWWNDSRGFTFDYNQRGHQLYRVVEVDAASGNARTLIEESSATFVNYEPLSRDQFDHGKSFRQDIADGKEIVWASERDGREQLYLYDGHTGELKRQITRGDWVVRAVDRVDEAKREIYFEASGMNPDDDPYFVHGYRIAFDGSGLTPLSPAPADHKLNYSPDGKYYVDTYSRLDLPPVMELRRSVDASLLMTVDTADATALRAAGWQPAEPFHAQGREGKTVIRGSFTLKNYTEGAQNFWSIGSNSGANFNTYYYANAVTPQPGVTPGAGFYNAGAVLLGGALPALTSTSPSPFQAVIPIASQTFSGTGYSTFDPNIKQPYVESWSFGIQRQITPSSVLEVRYVGNVAKEQWLLENFNEVNIFENGFLKEFQGAQANLSASGGTTFQGANPTPIMDQAFQTSGLTANYTNGTFINYVKQGQAGALASALAGSPTFLCSLVGANFSPCAANSIPGSGTYPINFFQENPYAAGAGNAELTNAGYSNYNGLQADFRQNAAHGVQFDANYTYSKSLGTSVQGSTAPGYYGGRSNSAGGFYTLRNKWLNYFPSAFDVRHVFHASGTYDFPFGLGKTYFNKNHIVDRVIGGWTLGAITTWESGEPWQFTGGTSTVNGNDSGVTLIGVTPSQLQKQLHPRVLPGKTYVSMFDPKYINQANGEANSAYIQPASTPGQFGRLLWLHDPSNFSMDLSLNKQIPIASQVKLKLQGVFLNAFNHVAWYGDYLPVQSSYFGTTASASGPRNIEVRANIEF